MKKTQGNKAAIRKVKKRRDAIITVIMIVLLISGPAIGIYNAASISGVSKEVSKLHTYCDEVQGQLESIEKEDIQSKDSLSKEVKEMESRIKEVEKTYQYVNRGGFSRAVPTAIDTSHKTYMDYRCLTAGKQADMQKSAWTDSDGFRRYNEDYMVAMGSYYGTVGDRLEVTFSSGTVITVILGDAKSDSHTDALHMHRNGNVIEFIVDTKTLNPESKQMGDVSYSGFEGTVKTVRNIV